MWKFSTVLVQVMKRNTSNKKLLRLQWCKKTKNEAENALKSSVNNILTDNIIRVCNPKRLRKILKGVLFCVECLLYKCIFLLSTSKVSKKLEALE